MKKLGIIGGGSFGKFLQSKLALYFDVAIFDRAVLNSEKISRLIECEVVILAITLESYEDVLAQIKPRLAKEAVVIDTCSVKQKPASILKELLPNNKYILTHPLFGPDSAAESMEGHTMVICPVSIEASELEQSFASTCEGIGLLVKFMTAKEHDELMAELHGLTFFVAKTLDEYGVSELPVMTPSYKSLVELAKLQHNHSDRLIASIQKDNPSASLARQKFLKIAEDLHKSLEK